MVDWTFHERPDYIRNAVNDALAEDGDKWFVDAKLGNNSNRGDLPDAPLLTMAAAFAKLKSGAKIFVRGKVREQLTTPAGVFDVEIVGLGNRPRHPDDHTEADGLRGSSASAWVAPASPADTTPLIKVQQQGWRIRNMLFQAHTDAAAIQVFRDGGAGDAERDGSHFHLIDCRIDAGQDGVEFHGGPNFVTIERNQFRGQTGNAIKNTVGAGIGTLLATRIIDNQFSAITAAIVAGLSTSFVLRNMIDAGLDLTGGVAPNTVTENVFMGDYSNTGGYVAVTGDFWFNNHALDTAEGEVDADGKINAVPA